jgi:hypothetical protein
MKINEDVLRYLSVRLEKLDNAPSALMQNRGFRDDVREEVVREVVADVADVEVAAKSVV